MTVFQLDHIEPLEQELHAHPIYQALGDLSDLRVFMAHHVYAVWDFMSLLKYLQQRVAPCLVPWTPAHDTAACHWINQRVLEEESDTLDTPDGPAYLSRFERYRRAMEEVGADAATAGQFITAVARDGLTPALESFPVPQPAHDFMETTFCFISEDKPHEVAAAVAAGRERVIPQLFRRFLEGIKVAESDAPGFHAYLKRHLDRNTERRTKQSMRLLDHLCDHDPKRIAEAEAAAEEAICARIRFWDGILEQIQQART